MQSKTKLVTVLKQWCKLLVNTNKHEDLNLVSADHGREDGIYRLTIIEIAKAHKKDHQIYSKKDAKTSKLDWCFQLIENIIVLYKDENL
jgi:hypothetical protein